MQADLANFPPQTALNLTSAFSPANLENTSAQRLLKRYHSQGKDVRPAVPANYLREKQYTQHDYNHAGELGFQVVDGVNFQPDGYFNAIVNKQLVKSECSNVKYCGEEKQIYNFDARQNLLFRVLAGNRYCSCVADGNYGFQGTVNQKGHRGCKRTEYSD